MNPRELRVRLALDARVIARLRSPHLGAIRGYASPSHLDRREAATATELAGGGAIFWTVEYRSPMLAGPDRPLSGATAVFNLLAGGGYPDTPPSVTFVTRPFPWCGHVLPVNGSICLGDGWARARGQITLAHLVIHVMRLVNFHEPATDDGNNVEALRYGRSVLSGQPLRPDLVYPALPADILHGVFAEQEDEAGVHPSATALFLPRGVSARMEVPSGGGLFLPREHVRTPVSSGLFLPRGVLR